jgi:hypothetical protein
MKFTPRVLIVRKEDSFQAELIEFKLTVKHGTVKEAIGHCFEVLVSRILTGALSFKPYHAGTFKAWAAGEPWDYAENWNLDLEDLDGIRWQIEGLDVRTNYEN